MSSDTNHLEQKAREQKAREFVRLYGDHTTGEHFAPVPELDAEEREAIGGRTFNHANTT